MKGDRMKKLKEAVAIGSELSVKCGKEVFAHGVKAIAEYSEERVRLRLSDMTLCVNGTGLVMKSFFGGAVCVMGDIRGLDFER